jgi:hypothetical protein
MLQKSQGNHRQQRMVMEPLPRPTLEVIEAQLFLQLLVPLFTTPPRFDRPDDGSRRHVGGMVGEIEFPLARGASLPDQPHFFSGQVLTIGEFGAIRYSDPDDGKARLQVTLRATPPFHRAPLVSW